MSRHHWKRTHTYVHQRHRRCLIIITITTTTLRTVNEKPPKFNDPVSVDCKSLCIRTEQYRVYWKHISLSHLYSSVLKKSFRTVALIESSQQISVRVTILSFQNKVGWTYNDEHTSDGERTLTAAGGSTRFTLIVIRWPRLLYDGLCASVYWCLVTYFQFSYLFEKKKN